MLVKHPRLQANTLIYDRREGSDKQTEQAWQAAHTAGRQQVRKEIDTAENLKEPDTMTTFGKPDNQAKYITVSQITSRCL